jgi:hypothetical protein
MNMNGYEVIPGAKRLIKSLRDMGYDFATAVADVVDNSIEAKSSVVRIDVVWSGEKSYVLIADNGTGMSGASLREAMRFGAERDYDAEDLGKFGLGMKTASMSQCTKLTVASRQNEKRADISAYCWDIGHVSATNRWEILPVSSQSLIPEVRQHLKETTGTVVIWENLDRILGYKLPEGEVARKNLMTMCRELEDHLAMVFHRFLAGEVRGKKLAIYINNNKIVPWDPFARSEGETQKLETVSIRVEGESAKSDIVIEPFILPPQSKFSSSEAHARASGPNKWNRQQGFYIYRADRMIQSGGWSNIRTLDEHLKLARVALSFNPRIDDAFKINVAKMRVALPASVRDEIAEAISPLTSLANKIYRSAEKGVTRPVRPPVKPPVPSPSQQNDDPTINVPAGGVSPFHGGDRKIPPSPPHVGGKLQNLEVFGTLLLSVARPDEQPVVERVLARARAIGE